MAKNTPKQKMEKVEVDKHKIWLILAIGIAVVAIAFLLLYSPARVGVFGKAVSVGTSSDIKEGMTYLSKFTVDRITINSSAVAGTYTLSFATGRFGSVTASLKASNGNIISEMKYNQNDSVSRSKPFVLKLNYFNLSIIGPITGESVNVSLLPRWLNNKTITLQEVSPACVVGFVSSCSNATSCKNARGYWYVDKCYSTCPADTTPGNGICTATTPTATCTAEQELVGDTCFLSGDFNNDKVVNESDFSDLTKITEKINSLKSNLQELNKYLWVVYHNFQPSSGGAQ
ncbi:MAG: hypothetical protein V2A62_03055 [Candidatus Woesearchaeota archaeon]